MKSLTIFSDTKNSVSLPAYTPYFPSAHLNFYNTNILDPFRAASTLIGKRPMVDTSISSNLEFQKRQKLTPTTHSAANFFPHQGITHLMPQSIPLQQGEGYNTFVDFPQMSPNFPLNTTKMEFMPFGRPGGIMVKEEFIKLEEGNLKLEDEGDRKSSNLGWDQHLLQETNAIGKIGQNNAAADQTPRRTVEESPLSEFTKLYPDWDLVTIFRHIESGNTYEPCRASQRIRMKNSGTLLGRKLLKEVEYPDSPEIDEDYRPGKSIKVNFRQKKKNKKGKNEPRKDLESND